MKAVGIDIGTTSICVVGWDVEKEKVITSLSGDNAFVEGTFEQNPESIVRMVKKLLEKVLDKMGKVDSIGVSTQMHGILYVDDEGKAVSPYYTWKNSYGQENYKGSTYAEWLTKKTGYSMYTGYGTVTHFYLGQNKQIPPRAKYLANIGDYLIMRLCGLVKPIMNSTLAASLGGFDLETVKLNVDKLKEAGVDTSYYAELVSEIITVGTYKKIPVFVGIGDNQASVYASVREKDYRININVGTGSQISIFNKDLIHIHKGEVRPYLNLGYLYVQASISGGKVYEKLAGFFQEIISAFTIDFSENKSVEIEYIYKKMEEIGISKQTTGLQIHPSLYGSRSKSGVGSIEVLTEQNFHLPDFIRAYVEGMALELYELYMDFPEQLRHSIKEIVISGNGIKKNRLLQQEVQKKFMLPMIYVEIEEEAAIGAAILSANRNKR